MRFSLTKRTFENNAIIAFFDLLGTCFLSKTLLIEDQSIRLLTALLSEFDVNFSDYFSEEEIKENFDISIFGDSIAINQRIKTKNLIERLIEFLLSYQLNILVNSNIQSRALLTKGSFFSFKFDRDKMASKSILASEFTNIGLCGGLGIIQADEELKGLPLGVYILRELTHALNESQQNRLIPVEDKNLFFICQDSKVNPFFFFSEKALEEQIFSQETGKDEIINLLNKLYPKIEAQKISPWLLANMGLIKKITPESSCK